MQGKPDFHAQITHPLAQEPTDVFEDATAFDATVDMFNGHPTVRKSLIGGLLFGS